MQSWAAESIGVIYPEVQPPYDQVYRSIIEGLEKQASVESFTFTPDTDSRYIDAWLARHQVKTIIGLGRKSGRHLASIERASNLKVVLGGSPFYRELSLPAVTLAPPPDCLLKQVKVLRPEIEKIHIVISPKYDAYALLSQNIGEFGVQIVVHRSESAKQAALHYKRLMSEMDRGKEALWLLGGIERGVLKHILKVSWQKRLTLVSNNLSHVKKGCLLSCFVDYEQHARDLLNAVKDESSSSFVYSNQPVRALNIRTAKHLGINVPKKQRKDYALTFPSESF